jgi:hypothetical protein
MYEKSAVDDLAAVRPQRGSSKLPRYINTNQLDPFLDSSQLEYETNSFLCLKGLNCLTFLNKAVFDPAQP